MYPEFPAARPEFAPLQSLEPLPPVLPRQELARASRENRRLSPLVGSLLLIFVTAVWGWTFTVVKDATRHYAVVPFLTIRFLMAAALMFPLAWRHAQRSTWWIGSVIGALVAAAYLLQTYGLQTTSASNCGLITGLFVIFAPLANRLVFGVATRPVLWLASVMSLFGLGLLIGGLDGWRPGDLLTFGAAACFGLHIAMLDRVARHHDAGALAAVQFIAAGAIFAACWPWTDPHSPPLPPQDVWGALLLTSVVATALGFYVQTKVQQQVPAVQVALILMLEPVFATLFGIWLAGERLAAPQWVGALLMLLAMFVAEVMPRWATTGPRTSP